jgi:hypothetical protein
MTQIVGTYGLCNPLDTPRGSFAAAEHASCYRAQGDSIGKTVKESDHGI